MAYEKNPHYPTSYKDPDITEAENLTAAAYYLIAAGYSDAAQPFIDRAIACFEGAPFNKKLDPPAKMLGRVRYMPYGVICFDNGSDKYAVPAPAYDAGDEAELADQDRKSRAKRGNEACRRARIGWFPQKQATAMLSGKLPNTATFRPAAILKKILALCEAYDQGMPREARAMLGDKLADILKKNPLSTGHWNQLRQNLADAGGGRYHHYGDEVVLGFAYLTAAEAKIAGDILAKDSTNATWQLNDVEQESVKWTECPAFFFSDVRSTLEASKERQDALDRIPFLKLRYEAYQKQFVQREDGAPPYYYYQSQEYGQAARLHDAAQAVQDVNNLMRCHAALCRHPDEYFHKLMLDCKMIDETLDENLPPDLPIRAGLAVCARVWIVPKGSDVEIDEKIAAMAEAAFIPVLEESGGLEKLDSPLLHPPVKDNEPEPAPA